MTFDELLTQVIDLLRREGRVSYRALKRRFNLDNEYLEDLKAEILKAKKLALDEDGEVLVWTGASPVSSSTFQALNPSQPPTPTPQSLAERRQLTVMFCDLVGSTALSTQLDPEELRDVISKYQEACAAVIQRYEGYIAQYLGDGLLVYFGYPNAHEDDAARAVHAGLEIISALHEKVPSPLAGEPVLSLVEGGQGEGVDSARYTPHPGLPPQEGRENSLQVRIGIHTGPVVVGEIGGRDKRENLALGETPNIAARIQGVAEPGTVVLSVATHRLIAGLFDCQDEGAQTLKGATTPVILHRVLAESAARHRLDVAPPTGLTPLVGREEELALLQRRWEQVKDREGQVVLLSGEPGIGKSRMVRELRDRVAREEATCIEFRCSPYHQNSALHPLIEHVQRVLQWQKDDSPQTKLAKLRATLARYHFPQADTIVLLAALLSLPQPADAPPLNLSPQRQKQKTKDALIAWLVEETERAPVYCVWEDLHWADPSTLEFLGTLIEQTPTARLFVLLTSRPEFSPQWGQHGHVSQLTLNRLGRRQIPQMIAKTIGGKTLPAAVVQQIVAKTDGVPLFVEELTKMVLESEFGVGARRAVPLRALGIPATLQDALMARLDRLGSAKEIAQLSAALGREFSYELLHAVSPLDEHALQNGLRRLVEAELLYQRGTSPQSTYFFKHALIQDTAYQSLLKSRRQQLHRQIAFVLEEQFSETKETQSELLAHHYTEAGLTEQAIPYWQQAGERADQRSAYTEAVAHLTKGLGLLKTLADTPEHLKQELTLQLALSDALAAVKGYAAPEVGKAVTRARTLCQQLGETPQLSSMLYRLSLFSMIRGEVQTAHALAQQMLRVAQSLQDEPLLAQAHTRLGWTLYTLGELTSARPHLEEAIALCDPQRHPRHIVKAYSPRVECLSYTASTLWYLGYPDQALQRSREAMAVAEELSRPHLLAYALGAAALFHSFREEGSLARERAEAVMTLSIEQGFPFWLGYGTIVRGWALAEQGQVEEGVAQIRQGLATHRATGGELVRPYFLTLLAEAYGKAGQGEKGLNALAEALTLVEENRERITETKLYWLKGELILQQFKVQSSKFKVANTQHLATSIQAEAEAEACFLRAIEISRKQQAKSRELRATTSLARLWRQQGKQHEAHKVLSEIYTWFTEGFDTKDLQEAKALLEELRQTGADS